MYTRGGCPSCSRVLLALQRTGVRFSEVDIERQPQQWEKLRMMCAGLEVTDLPQVFFGFKHIGGVDEVLDLERSGELEEEIAQALSEDTGFDLSYMSSKFGTESKQTTTDISAEVSISISEIDEGSEEDVFVQMRIKEAVRSWSGAQVTPAASETEDSPSEASEEGQEEIQPRRGTRGAVVGGTAPRRTPADAVRAVARAVGVLPAGPAADGETQGRITHGTERNADDRATDRDEENSEREERNGGDASIEATQETDTPDDVEQRGDAMGGEEQIEKRQRIKTAIRSWTGSEELEPEERIEQAIKLWKGEEEQQPGLSSTTLSQARSRGINSRTRGLLPITSGRRSSADPDTLESPRHPRLSGILGLRETTRVASTNSAKCDKWEQRWFVLYDSELLCFHSQKDQKRRAFPIHTWFLSCAQVSVPMVTSTQGKGSWGQSHVLRLRIVMGKVLSEYFLSAKSKRVLDNWILELNEAIEVAGSAPNSLSPVASRRVKSEGAQEQLEVADLG